MAAKQSTVGGTCVAGLRCRGSETRRAGSLVSLQTKVTRPLLYQASLLILTDLTDVKRNDLIECSCVLYNSTRAPGSGDPD